jgi:hypothetical protein
VLEMSSTTPRAKRKLSWAARIAIIGLVFIVAGAASINSIGGTLIVIGVIAVFVGLGGMAYNRDTNAIRNSAPGSVRSVTTKASRVNNEIQRYQTAGWSLINQSSSKSFGSQAQVTLTFRKG